MDPATQLGEHTDQYRHAGSDGSMIHHHTSLAALVDPTLPRDGTDSPLMDLEPVEILVVEFEGSTD